MESPWVSPFSLPPSFGDYTKQKNISLARNVMLYPRMNPILTFFLISAPQSTIKKYIILIWTWLCECVILVGGTRNDDKKKMCNARKNTAGFQTFSDSESHTGNIFSILHGDFFKLKNAKKLYMYFLFLYKKHNKTSSHQQHNSSSDINNINFFDYY